MWSTAAAESLPANRRCSARPLRRVLEALLLSSLGCATSAPVACCSTGPEYASLGPPVEPIWTRWGVQTDQRGVRAGAQLDKSPSLTRLFADSHPMRGGSKHDWIYLLAFWPWVSCALTGKYRRYDVWYTRVWLHPRRRFCHQIPDGCAVSVSVSSSFRG